MNAYPNLVGGPKKLHDERLWTQERVIASFRKFERAMGRWPTAGDASATSPSVLRRMTAGRIAELGRAKELGLRLPDVGAVRREFGSWVAGREAAAGGALVSLEEVCPRCGDFVVRLYDHTGWCRACTE